MRVTQILARKRKNNPILLGEPGVGKTAIAEGLARAVVTRTNADGSPLPEFLIGKRVMQLDVGLLMAGAKVGADTRRLAAVCVALVAESRGLAGQATSAPLSSCIPPLTTSLTCPPACGDLFSPEPPLCRSAASWSLASPACWQSAAQRATSSS